MHDNEHTLTRFYTAFADLDSDTMRQCYAPDATFDDPAFSLRGVREVGGMWQMLCEATKGKGRTDWKLRFRDIQADASSGRAHWEAHYRFSASKRMVHNVIDAQFTFTPEGLIATHRDHFDFWRWSRQALGRPGFVLGWVPFFKNMVRRQAQATLQKYLDKEGVVPVNAP